MAEVRIEGLSKRFGEFVAFNDLNLDVAKGEVVALLGPSGCGKTTLLRCVAGLEQPTSGVIDVGGEALVSPTRFVPPAQRNIAMVFQSYALWPHMNVWENVSYGLRVQKMQNAVINERVSDVLALLGLSHLKDRYPSQLSGGQQQRVAVARALALRADVVLFDEPLSNLDLKLREGVRTELRRVLKKLNQTAIYVTHDIGEAVVVADRIAMMSSGAIVQLGSPHQIYHEPANRLVAEFVGNTNIVSAQVRRDSGKTLLHVGNHMSFCADRSVGSVPAKADTVQVMIRPEYVEVAEGVDGGIPATIRDVEFIGQVTKLLLDVSGTTLEAIALSRPNIKFLRDGSCSIRIADENIVILPEAA